MFTYNDVSFSEGEYAVPGGSSNTISNSLYRWVMGIRDGSNWHYLDSAIWPDNEHCAM
jgi:hypothetical protein